jgi:hypothetical protein
MSPVKKSGALLTCIAFLGVLSGSPSPAESSPERHRVHSPPGDSTLFSFLVRYVRDEGLWTERSTPAVDPRAVDSLQNAFTITEQDLMPLSDDRLETRRRILDRLDVQRTNILRDVKCTFTGGLPAIDSTGQPRPTPARCKEQGAFTSVVFGMARPTSDCNGEAKRAAQCATVRAIESTEYSFFEYKLTLAYLPDHGWTVIRKRKISGAAS